MPPKPQKRTITSLLTPEVTSNLSPERLARIEEAYEHGLAKGTNELYRKQWNYFEKWCADNGLCPKPAELGTVAAYMTDRAPQAAQATLQSALAAIRSYHEEDDLISPTQHPHIRKLMKGLAREYPRPQKQVAPIDNDNFDLIIAAAHIPKEHETQEMADRRASFDIALTSFMRDAMLRRSEAANAEWQHISRTNDGKSVLEIPTSKTDQTGKGASGSLSPFTIRSLADMLRLRRGDPPKPEDKIFLIGKQQIANRIKAAAKHAGLQGRFSGHSLRIGTAIDLAVAGVELPAMMQAGRWDSVRNVSRYISQIQASNNAVSRLQNKRHPNIEADTEWRKLLDQPT